MVKIVNGIYEVEVMADSFVRVPKELNPVGYVRITTIRAWIARIILAELNTHRLLSRNSASSRAIPIEKMIAWVLERPFVPDRFPRKHTGMQAPDDQWVYPGEAEYDQWVAEWLAQRDAAVQSARKLHLLGMSKQLVNRLLEPFLLHQVIITATEWENFLALRADTPAQNEIRIIAEMILKALNESVPTELLPGEWHLPYGDKIDEERLKKVYHQSLLTGIPLATNLEELRIKRTAACCARVSYQTFEGKDDYEADVKLYNQLRTSGHWSPFEHVARAMTPEEYQAYSQTYPEHVEYGWCGNFRGFIQLRKTFARTEENRQESRLRQLAFEQI